MQRLGAGALALIIMALAGCASGPRFDGATSLAPVSPEKARIYFYRSTALGAAVRPEVHLNGAVVGKAEPNVVFYVDRDPGKMEVVSGTEVDRKLTFISRPGQTRYVRLQDVNFIGFVVPRVVPELISEAEARKEMADLALVGAPK